MSSRYKVERASMGWFVLDTQSTQELSPDYFVVASFYIGMPNGEREAKDLCRRLNESKDGQGEKDGI